MLRRSWQSAMIALARSPVWKRRMQEQRSASGLARRYVGGADVAEAVDTAKALRAGNIRASLFYLGEYVDSPALVEENVEAKIAVARRLAAEGLDVHVSVDPTQIGCAIDWERGCENAERIAEVVLSAAGRQPGVHCVMLDMEDFSVNSATLELHDRLRKRGFPMAQTLQAYLRKTYSDMEWKIAQGAKVRLVKGAFAAGADIAFTNQDEIKASYRSLIDLMLGDAARASGFYPIFATHDHALQAHVIEQARAKGWAKGSYEFEMLYGARPDIADDLAHAGERIRLYLPFGRDWWPYAVRRIGENPRNALLLARSLVSAGS